MNNNPRHPDEITPQWLTQILRVSGVITKSSVASIRVDQLAKGKAWLSSIGRVEVRYDSDTENAPSAFVIKMLSQSDGHRDAEYELGAYKREIAFYEHIAPGLPIRLPNLYYSNNRNLMLMEDLSSLTAGDQIQGMTYEQVLITLESLAKVQAAYWNSPALEKIDWLPHTNSIELDYNQNWDSFVELCGDFIDPLALKVGERLRDNIPWLVDEVSKRPCTLVHDDMKADNLLFGEAGSDMSVVILDWQFVIRSMGAIDVARLIGGSLHPKERQGHQHDAMKHWYDKVLENGAEDYSWDDAQRDMKLGALYCLCFPVHFHKGIQRAQGRALEYIKTLYSGLFLFALDLGAETVLD